MWRLQGTRSVFKSSLEEPQSRILSLFSLFHHRQFRKSHLDTLAGCLFAGKWCLNLLNPHPKQLCKTYTHDLQPKNRSNAPTCMRAYEGEQFNLLVYINIDLFYFIFFTEREQLPLNLPEMTSGSSFFQVYFSCLTNSSTPFNTQLI